VAEREIARKIIAHRGLWTSEDSQNSQHAIISALKLGFGVETDIRDNSGHIVIAHDPPVGGETNLVEFLTKLAQVGLTSQRIFALNVKSDGLLSLSNFTNLLSSSAEYYFFDMSFPQQLHFAKSLQPIAQRVSEYEPPSLDLFLDFGLTPRFWIDGFESDWWLGDSAVNRLVADYRTTVVSPELHRRQPDAVWEWFAVQTRKHHSVTICTDHPQSVLEACT